MSEWSNFYKDRMNESYRNHLRSRYKPFLDTITSYKPKDIAEYGCGAANITSILIEDNNHIQYNTVVDIDKDILSLAKSHTNLKNANFIHGDICNLTMGSFDLIHSHGVLEHLSNEQIHKTIISQLKSAPVLVHYVPSWKYQIPSFGDERLLNKDQWNNICEPSNIIEFNDGYDYILVWEK